MTAPPSFSLSGKVAIVTGASRGIGRALAIGLAESGASVVVSSRSIEACDVVVDQIEAAGGTASSHACDIGHLDEHASLVDAAASAYGRLDILVNNAGLLRPHLTTRVSEDELDELVQVNLKGPVFLSCAALPLLEADGGGAIVNISALGAFQPMEGIGAYCAVKAAMVNWTTTMAREWAARGVRVNSLVPGPVATDMILPRDPAAREAFVTEMGAKTLHGRLAEPEELVGAAVYLASEAARFTTGRPLFVDGGMLA